MNEQLEQIFAGLLEVLVTEGYVKLDHYFADGTKIEGRASRYTFVWKKAVVKHQAKLKEKVKQLFIEMDEWNQQEIKSLAAKIYRN